MKNSSIYMCILVKHYFPWFIEAIFCSMVQLIYSDIIPNCWVFTQLQIFDSFKAYPLLYAPLNMLALGHY